MTKEQLLAICCEALQDPERSFNDIRSAMYMSSETLRVKGIVCILVGYGARLVYGAPHKPIYLGVSQWWRICKTGFIGIRANVIDNPNLLVSQMGITPIGDFDQVAAIEAKTQRANWCGVIIKLKEQNHDSNED